MRNQDHPKVVARAAFFDGQSGGLVASALGRTLERWADPPRALSGQYAFFADTDVLVIVSTPGASQTSVDLASAWGLAYGGDRDVVLMLPDQLAWPTLQRLP